LSFNNRIKTQPEIPRPFKVQELPIFIDENSPYLGSRWHVNNVFREFQKFSLSNWNKYADDTILFMEHDLEKARNMKLLLCAFEQLSGLKINFHRSEIFCFGEAKDSIAQNTELFGCNDGDFPLKYLGIPIHFRKLSNADWK
jgi:hypothetical protein